MKIMRRTIVALAAILLAATGPARAVDGVIEINQERALAGGVTPNDTPGFPVTITPGSYRLTGNLLVPDANTTAISPAPSGTGALGVTIDLNGFEIRGPNTCSGANCTQNGSGAGIGGSGQVTVTNGTVIGMGSTCISVVGRGRVENVLVRNCGGSGISGDTGVVIRNNRIYDVRLSGISVFFNPTGAQITNNMVFRSGTVGIDAADSPSQDISTASITGNTVISSGQDGIRAGSGSVVIGNVVRSSTGFGLVLGSGSGYAQNVLNANTAGQVSGAGSGNQLGTNVCGGSTSCP